MPSRSLLAAMAPFLFVCLWATGFIGARLGMPHSEPGTFLAIRFAAAAALLAIVALLAGATWPRGRDARDAIVVGMLLHGFYLGGVFWAIDRGMPAAVAAVIVGLQPLLTAILAGWLLGETVTKRHWLGTLIGIAGVALVVQPGLSGSAIAIDAQSVAVTLLAMISVTLGTIYQKATGGMADMRSATSLQYVGAFLPVFALAWLAETNAIDWTVEMIVAMLWSILGLSVGAIFLLLWLIRQGSVSRLSTVFFLVPAVAALMAYALFGEELTLVQITGMALCGLAVAMANRRVSG